MSVISDGTGSGRTAKVDIKNRLTTVSESNPNIYFVSKEDAQAYNLTSIVASAAAGAYVFYLKNTSTTQNIHVRSIEYHSDEAVRWTIWSVSGTAAGTDIVPTNMNLGSGNLAVATCKGDAAVTGLTQLKRIGVHRTAAGGDAEMHFDDALILTAGTAIAIEYAAGTTGACEIDCFFHYELI